MLHYQTIDKATLELLKTIQSFSCFENLRLVGGTSLALQIGHRKSIDLDLFGEIDADEFEISNVLNHFNQITILKKSANINIYSINQVKVDIVNYPYPWIESEQIIDSLKLAHKKDIAAMKIAAITNRGTKKDFVDIYFLLNHFPLQEILNFYLQKYHDGSEFLALKSLLYFDDAEPDEDLDMLEPISWKDVKQTIIAQVKAYSI